MAPRFKNILVKFIYLGGVTSANIISGLDPQELDRPLLSAKTACPKLGALANAASFARNSCIGGRVLTANGLGVRLCQLAAALPTHVGHLGDRFGCSGRGLAAPQITPKKCWDQSGQPRSQLESGSQSSGRTEMLHLMVRLAGTRLPACH